jgi:hypothetical protein
MAKRFTDTDKWKKAWFRQLGHKLQNIWNYLCDSCDHSGVWDVDMGLLEFQTGVKISLEEILSVFQGKVYLFDHGSKLWVVPFFEFQYGSTKEEFKARVSALRRLREFSLVDEFGNPSVSLTEDLAESPEQLPNCLGIGIGIGTSIGIGTGKKGGVGENKTPAFDFEALYQKYPRKEGKAAGLLACRKQIKAQDEYEALSLSIDRYAAHCARSGQLVKHFSSFLGSEKTGHTWREWIDPQTGSGAIPIDNASSAMPDLSDIFGEAVS